MNRFTRPFDVGAFMADVDAHRSESSYRWAEVAHTTNVSVAMIRFMLNGQRTPSVETATRLASWAGLDVNNYVKGPGH